MAPADAQVRPFGRFEGVRGGCGFPPVHEQAGHRSVMRKRHVHPAVAETGQPVKCNQKGVRFDRASQDSRQTVAALLDPQGEARPPGIHPQAVRDHRRHRRGRRGILPDHRRHRERRAGHDGSAGLADADEPARAVKRQGPAPSPARHPGIRRHVLQHSRPVGGHAVGCGLTRALIEPPMRHKPVGQAAVRKRIKRVPDLPAVVQPVPVRVGH